MDDDRPVVLDEYPVHQAPLSMKHHVSGDRNAYDRCVFHVFDHAGRALLVAGLGVYPDTGVVDACATPRTGDRLHAVRASDALGDERMRLEVGPLRITVDEPLRRFTLSCAADPADPGGLSFDLTRTVSPHRFFQDLTVGSGRPGLPGFLRRGAVERRYAELTGHTPRAMEFHTLCAALRHAIVMLGIAYRQAYFGGVEVPADPDRPILHHAALAAMVRGRYWTDGDWARGPQAARRSCA
ncbi:hypothetical protein ACFWGM_05740, partial [Streptomyces roseolus]